MKLFTNILRDIHALVHGAEAEVTAFLTPLADSIAKNGGQALIEAATKAVAAAETPNTPGEAKFSAALALVASELKAAGIPIVVNAIHAAIEAAVANLNATKAV